jgi:hypothetical protein
VRKDSPSMRTCSQGTTCRASSRILYNSRKVSEASATVNEEFQLTLKIDEQLGTLEVPTSDTNVVLGAGVVELCQTPVDESQLSDRRVSSELETNRRGGLENAPASSRDQSSHCEA